MNRLSHRERVLKVLGHLETDRVPIDFGGTTATGITSEAYRNLKGYLGIGKVAPAVMDWDQRSQLALVDEEVLEKFDVDTRFLTLGKPDSWEVCVDGDGSYIDEWGVERKKPPQGHYYVSKPPLEGDIRMADLRKFPWPDPRDPGRYRGLRRRAEALRSGSNSAVILNLGSPFVHQAQFLRGFENWLIDTAANKPLAQVS